ncbi:MAG: hypothetical protein E7351_03410 [Clostridiales bacterium]|nr:hypothetical protein [Clostridiales bacterium]
MSRFKIVNLIDKIFVSIAVFLIIYAWINFFVRDLITTFIISLVFSFAVVFLLYFFINKKQTKISTNKKNLEDINEKHLAFRLMSNEEKLRLIYDIISTQYEKKLDGKTTVILATHIEKLSQNDLINIICEVDEKFDTIEIICNEYQPNIRLDILSGKKIKLVDKNKLYKDYFEKANIFPDLNKINTKINKPTFKEILKNFFLPHKAKSYFFCGLILIFSSIILPYHYYYIIFGTVLLIFAILCKIYPLIHRD